MPKNNGSMISSAGGALAIGGVLLALGGSGSGNGDDGENGDGENPDQSPEASINLSIASGEVTASADASDPNGTVEHYDWELKQNTATFATLTGNPITFTPPTGGDYTLHLYVTDDGANQTHVTQPFEYTPPDEPDNGGTDDPDDGNGDDDNGGSDPPTNESPQVTLGFTTGNGQVEGSASGSDPDGEITSWDWTLKKGASVVDTASGGPEPTLSLAGSGDYQLIVEVTDDDGASATDSYSFPYEDESGGSNGGNDDGGSNGGSDDGDDSGGGDDDDGYTGECSSDADCPSNLVCSGGNCVPETLV